MLIIIVTTFAIALSVTFVLALLPSGPTLLQLLIDASLTVILSFPALYFFSFRPMAQHQARRAQAEAALRRWSEELEERIQERTADLEVANTELQAEIAERVRSDAALSESELRYHSLFSGMTEGFALHEVICDENGKPCDFRFLDVNPAFERQTGLTRANVVGRTHNEVLPDDDPRWVREYGAVALTGEPIRFENYSPALDRLYDVFAYRPASRQFAVIFRDITERRRTEEALRVYEQLASYSRDIILFVRHSDGKLLEVNAAACSAYGYSRDEFLNLSIHDLRAPDTRAQTIGQMAEAYRHGILFETTHRRKDGSTFPVEVSSQGAIVGGAQALISVIRDITERKRAAQQLYETNQRLQALFQAAPIGVSFSDDATCQHITGNTALLAQFEIGDQDNLSASAPDVSAAGRQVRYFMGGREVTDAELPLQRAVAENRNIPPMELEVVMPNGRRWFAEASGAPVRDMNDRVIGGLALTVDITERKRIEAALRQSEQRFRIALNNSPITVATLDRDLRYTWVYNTRHGFRPETVLGKRPDELLPAEDTIELTALLEHVLETGVVERREVSGRNQGRTWVYDVTAEPVFDEHGAVTGLTIANVDIADRRQVEDELRRARAELEQRVEERTRELTQANEGLRAEIAQRKWAERQIRLLSAAMETAANGILITDRRGNIEWCNPALANMTGFSTAELIGQTPRIFRSGEQDHDFYARFWSVILSGQTWHGEIINRRANGSSYTEEQTVTPMLDEEGRIIHFIAIKQDVTERKQDQARLEQNNRDLQSLSQSEHRARQIAEILATANRAFTQTLDMNVVTETLLDYVGQLVPYDSACVILLEGESRLGVKATRGYERWTDPAHIRGLTLDAVANSIARAMITQQASVIVADTQTHPGWETLPGAEHIRSWLGVPLTVEGRVIGLCSLDKVEPDYFTPDHLRLAEAVVGQAAVALQNAWLFEQVRAGRERLAALSHRLVQVQDAERSYIARELHDEAGQLLTSLLVGLRLLQNDADDPAAVVAGVSELSHMVEDVLAGLHRLAIDLRPASLDHLGLLPAIRQHIDGLMRKHRLLIDFDATCFESAGSTGSGEGTGRARLPANVETTLYRFVQEALTNVIRHAHATHAQVRVERLGQRVRAVVSDDGVGFDLSTPLSSGEGNEERLGLFGMRERAGMLGGNLSIVSAPGAGATVTMEVSSDDPRPDYR